MQNSRRIHGEAMSQQTKHIYEFGSFRLDVEERLLLRDAEAVPLTPKTFDLLLVLLQQPGHLLSKDELLKLVWPDNFVEESNLTSNISQLRKALGEGENGRRYIETVPKRGYRFVAEITRAASEEAPQASSAEAGSDIRSEINGARRYRRSAVFVLALLVVAGAAFGLYQLISRRQSRPRISVPALQITPLTSFSGWEWFPSFSPDGEQIVFTWNGDICVKQMDGQGFLRLTNNPAGDIGPVWSPDGRQIAFARYAPEGSGVYLVPAIGGIARKLTSLAFYRPGYLERPTWSPDGKLLAIAIRNTAEGPLCLYLLSIETGERRQLTYLPLGLVDHGSPAFSPDGKTIAFIQHSRKSDAPFARIGSEQRIYLIPSAGGNPTRLRLESSGGEIPNIAAHPMWTPDGKELVFSSFQTSQLPSKLWRVPASGGVVEEIPVGAKVQEPAISAQGNRLAFVQMEEDLDIWQIDLRKPAERTPATKFISSTWNDSNPLFSPDGRKILFASNRSGKASLWICDSDGSNPRLLTSDSAGSADWSPDGQQIAFDSLIDGSNDVCVVSAEGGNWRRMTTGLSTDSFPVWSRDGRWIYFNSNRSGQEQIWKLPSGGGEAVQVTQQGGYLPFTSPDGKFIYYAKKRGIAGIWRVPAAGGEESFVLNQHEAGLLGKHWTVTDEGIYFVSVKDPAHPLVEFFSFATGKVSQVSVLERPIHPNVRGLSVSPDKRWLLVTQVDRWGSDIMLVENFR